MSEMEDVLKMIISKSSLAAGLAARALKFMYKTGAPATHRKFNEIAMIVLDDPNANLTPEERRRVVDLMEFKPERASCNITFRVYADEYQAFLNLVQQAGLSKSEFCRRKIFGT